MSGIDVVFDTNALINFLNGNPSLRLYSSANVGLSVVTIIEFLAYPKITEADKILLGNFLKKVTTVDLELGNTLLVEKITELRKLYTIKLPDAIIAATALISTPVLITKDKDFSKIQGLTTITF